MPGSLVSLYSFGFGIDRGLGDQIPNQAELATNWQALLRGRGSEEGAAFNGEGKETGCSVDRKELAFLLLSPLLLLGEWVGERLERRGPSADVGSGRGTSGGETADLLLRMHRARA